MVEGVLKGLGGGGAPVAVHDQAGVGPRAACFPDFLTPPEATEGLDAGLEAVLATPRPRVLHTLTPLGAALLRTAVTAPGPGAARQPV
ncbi:hypothetical protein [Streptomyces sp. CA-179760]|uniref:hypothetical protein n=1 Tax=Streptomyces sp. CA-179760 TaxID=3240054 RepID=UPI003D93F123